MWILWKMRLRSQKNVSIYQWFFKSFLPQSDIHSNRKMKMVMIFHSFSFLMNFRPLFQACKKVSKVSLAFVFPVFLLEPNRCEWTSVKICHHGSGSEMSLKFSISTSCVLGTWPEKRIINLLRTTLHNRSMRKSYLCPIPVPMSITTNTWLSWCRRGGRLALRRATMTIVHRTVIALFLVFS